MMLCKLPRNMQNQVILFYYLPRVHHLICLKIIKNGVHYLNMKLGLFNTLVQKDTQRISVHKKSPKQSLVIDKWLFLCIIILSLFGLIMVYDASVAIAIRDFNDKYHFVRDQLRWFGIGVVGLFIFSRIDYHRLKPFVLPMLLVTLLLLLAVFIPGLGVRALGARRWINVGFFIVQPAEIAKLTLILYLSAWLSQPEKKRQRPA